MGAQAKFYIISTDVLTYFLIKKKEKIKLKLSEGYNMCVQYITEEMFP